MGPRVARGISVESLDFVPLSTHSPGPVLPREDGRCLSSRCYFYILRTNFHVTRSYTFGVTQDQSDRLAFSALDTPPGTTLGRVSET